MVTDDTGTAGNLGYSVSSNTFDAAVSVLRSAIS